MQRRVFLAEDEGLKLSQKGKSCLKLTAGTVAESTWTPLELSRALTTFSLPE